MSQKPNKVSKHEHQEQVKVLAALRPQLLTGEMYQRDTRGVGGCSNLRPFFMVIESHEIQNEEKPLCKPSISVYISLQFISGYLPQFFSVIQKAFESKPRHISANSIN